MTFGLKQRYW